MSKMAAIHTAISLQLAADGRNELAMLDTLAHATRRTATVDPVAADAAAPAAPPSVGARYDNITAPIFLARVAFRLRSDTPSLNFTWQTVTLDAATLPRWQLEETIGLQTVPADTKAPGA